MRREKELKITEIRAKTILSGSKVFDYALNPYVGCMHNCVYCYARFMKRFSGHRERWGEFVDVKINAPELLTNEISRKKRGRVWISGVCDPYQPIEKRYGLTGRCLEILAAHDWPVTVQTKSPLVIRDIEILKRFQDAEVGFTITTADESIRRRFEYGAPPIGQRLKAIEMLHAEGINTFVMIAPILPGADGLVELLKGKIDYVLLDRLNYHYADWLYRKLDISWAREEIFFTEKGKALKRAFDKEDIPCQMLF